MAYVQRASAVEMFRQTASRRMVLGVRLLLHHIHRGFLATSGQFKVVHCAHEFSA